MTTHGCHNSDAEHDPRRDMSTWRSLVVIGVMAFVIRLSLVGAFVGFNSAPDGSALPDQLDYELYAHHLSQGKGYVRSDGKPTANRMPGTSLTLFPVYVICGRQFGIGRIFFCLVSAGTCVVVGWLGWMIGGHTVGTISALLLGFYPSHAYYSLHFASEPPFCFGLALATALTVREFAGRNSTGVTIATGMAWGYTTLVRPHILLVLPLLVVLCLFDPARFRRHRVLVICCCALLVLVPWLGRNKLAMGKLMMSSVGAYTFWGAHNDKVLETRPGSWLRTSELVDELHPVAGSEVERMNQVWSYGFQFVRDNWSAMPYLVAMKFYRAAHPVPDTPNRLVRISFAVAWVSIVPFILIGVVVCLRLAPRDLTVLLLPIVATAGTIAIFYGSARFRDSTAPVYVVLATIGLLATWNKVAQPMQDVFRRAITLLKKLTVKRILKCSTSTRIARYSQESCFEIR